MFALTLFLKLTAKECKYEPVYVTVQNRSRLESGGGDVIHVNTVLSPCIYNTSTCSQMIINCTNVHQIKISKKLGKGVSKETYAGVFRGQDVAVKMVTPNVDDVKACTTKLKKEAGGVKIESRTDENKDCFVFPEMKMMKEILLINQLNHPGIIRLLGYCIRNEASVAKPDLQKHGIIAVYEKAAKITSNYIKKNMLLEKRLQTAHQLAELLDYLEHSPLGSLAMPDLKEGNLMLAGDRIKLSDLDDVGSVVKTCSKDSECFKNVVCESGRCVGENAAGNMDRAANVFFDNLLHCGNSRNMHAEISALRRGLNNGGVTAGEAMLKLEYIQRNLN